MKKHLFLTSVLSFFVAGAASADDTLTLEDIMKLTDVNYAGDFTLANGDTANINEYTMPEYYSYTYTDSNDNDVTKYTNENPDLDGFTYTDKDNHEVTLTALTDGTTVESTLTESKFWQNSTADGNDVIFNNGNNDGTTVQANQEITEGQYTYKNHEGGYYSLANGEPASIEATVSIDDLNNKELEINLTSSATDVVVPQDYNLDGTKYGVSYTLLDVDYTYTLSENGEGLLDGNGNLITEKNDMQQSIFEELHNSYIHDLGVINDLQAQIDEQAKQERTNYAAAQQAFEKDQANISKLNDNYESYTTAIDLFKDAKEEQEKIAGYYDDDTDYLANAIDLYNAPIADVQKVTLDSANEYTDNHAADAIYSKTETEEGTQVVTIKDAIAVNTEAISGNAEAIAANATAIETLNSDAEVEGSVAYTVKTEAVNAVYDEDNTIGEAIAANATAIETLNSDAEVEGSVAYTVKTEAVNATYDSEAEYAENTIGAAIASIGSLGGDNGLNVGNSLTNGQGEDGKPTTVVEALNNIDATLGTIHGLKDKSNLGADSNLAKGTTVEMHLVALDDAIGAKVKGENGNINKANSVNQNLDLIDAVIGNRQNINSLNLSLNEAVKTQDFTRAFEKTGNLIGDMSFDSTKYLSGVTNLSDAVRTLDSNLDRIDNKVHEVEKDMHSGMAAMAAMSAMVPNARDCGDTQISVGTGAYSDRMGIAAGAFHYFNDHVLMNAGASYGGNSQWAFRAGITFGL